MEGNTSSILEENTPIEIFTNEKADCAQSEGALTLLSSKATEAQVSSAASAKVSDTSSEISSSKPRPDQVVDNNISQDLNKKRNRKLKSKNSDQAKESSRDRKCKKLVVEKPKNNRKRTKLLSPGDESNATETIDLAQRRDVVNKTILRVLRRYLTNKFKELVTVEYDNKVDKHQKYFAYIRTLTSKMFGEDHEQFDTLHFYLASIIDHKYVKDEDIIGAGASRQELTTFYDCLYKYSHTRLVNLFSVKPLGVIYQHFYQDAKDSIVETETSLSKNKGLYTKIMEEFSLIFQGKIDINTLII